MKLFNYCAPWFCVLSAFVAIAIGMEQSPAMVPQSGMLEYNGVPLTGPDVPFAAQEEVCEGSTPSDGAFRLVGLTPNIKNPLILLEHDGRPMAYNN